jgi:hypothetical protein
MSLQIKKKTTVNHGAFRTIALSFIAGSVGLLMGCNDLSDRSGPYDQPWFDVFKHSCQRADPTPGCNFYAEGIKIHDLNDPSYNRTRDQRSYEYGFWSFRDSSGLLATYDGWAWLSPKGVLYDELGRALTEHSDAFSDDKMDQASDQEAQIIQIAGESFAERFTLQSSRGVQIAQTLNAWATLTRDRKSRTRTEQDVAEFSQRLFGIDVAQAKVALTLAEQGNLSQARELNAQIAKHWETSSATSARILMAWYKSKR